MATAAAPRGRMIRWVFSDIGGDLASTVVGAHLDCPRPTRRPVDGEGRPWRRGRSGGVALWCGCQALVVFALTDVFGVCGGLWTARAAPDVGGGPAGWPCGADVRRWWCSR